MDTEHKWKCLICGTENPSSVQYCSSCGASIFKKSLEEKGGEDRKPITPDVQDNTFTGSQLLIASYVLCVIIGFGLFYLKVGRLPRGRYSSQGPSDLFTESGIIFLASLAVVGLGAFLYRIIFSENSKLEVRLIFQRVLTLIKMIFRKR